MIHPNLVRAGQAAAKARGIHIGRKPGITTAIKVNDDQRKVVKRLKEEGESVAAIARTVQLARGTIYAILKAD